MFGTIRNTGNVELEIDEIIGRFYASNGTLLEQTTSDDNYIFIRLTLQVGASETFKLHRFFEPADYFRMEVTDGDGQTIPCTGCGPIGL